MEENVIKKSGFSVGYAILFAILFLLPLLIKYNSPAALIVVVLYFCLMYLGLQTRVYLTDENVLIKKNRNIVKIIPNHAVKLSLGDVLSLITDEQGKKSFLFFHDLTEIADELKNRGYPCCEILKLNKAMKIFIVFILCMLIFGFAINFAYTLYYPNATHEQYSKYLQHQIHSNWKHKNLNVNGEVIIEYTINEYGKTSDWVIVKSSGNAIADTEALYAIKTAQLYPPPKSSLKNGKARARYRFDYYAENMKQDIIKE